jgi:hypothetical protein
LGDAPLKSIVILQNRYSLRLDGFSFIRSGYTGGTVTTKPFKFQGDALFINYSTSAAGESKIALLDSNDKPIPGYDLENCEVIIGNEINKKVKWIGNNSLKSLEGKAIRLRIEMKDADLFSLKFE